MESLPLKELDFGLQKRTGPKETDLQCLICPTCNVLLDLSDLSDLLIVTFFKFVSFPVFSFLADCYLLHIT